MFVPNLENFRKYFHANFKNFRKLRINMLLKFLQKISLLQLIKVCHNDFNGTSLFCSLSEKILIWKKNGDKKCKHLWRYLNKKFSRIKLQQ